MTVQRIAVEVETGPEEGVAVIAAPPASSHPKPIDWFVLLVLVLIWGSTDRKSVV